MGLEVGKMELMEAACASGDSFTPAHDGWDSSSWGSFGETTPGHRDCTGRW